MRSFLPRYRVASWSEGRVVQYAAMVALLAALVVLPFTRSNLTLVLLGALIVVAIRLAQRYPLPAWAESRVVRYGLIVVLLAEVIIYPSWHSDNYIITLLTSICVYAMLGLGLNIVVGYAGLLDLGYAAFFAIGAYATAYLMTTHNFSFWTMLPIAALLAAVFGVIIGTPTLRLRSDYLAIVTLGFGEMTRISATNLDFTGGPNGIYGVPQPSIGGFTFQTPLHFYYLSLGLALITLFCVGRLGHGDRPCAGETPGLLAGRRLGRNRGRLPRRPAERHLPGKLYLQSIGANSHRRRPRRSGQHPRCDPGRHCSRHCPRDRALLTG